MSTLRTCTCHGGRPYRSHSRAAKLTTGNGDGTLTWDEYLASLSFDYSYLSIVTNMCLWLTGQPELSLIEPLSPGVRAGATLLFWSFIITSYFVLLNLLIAIMSDS